MLNSNSCFCWPSDSCAFIIVVSASSSGRFEWILHLTVHFSFSLVHGGSATLSGLWAAAEGYQSPPSFSMSHPVLQGCDGVSWWCSCGWRPEESSSFTWTWRLARLNKSILSPCAEDFDFSVLLSRGDVAWLTARPVSEGISCQISIETWLIVWTLKIWVLKGRNARFSQFVSYEIWND